MLSPHQRAAILLEKGVAAAQSGRREDAYAFFWAATELDPTNVRAWAWRAELCADPQEALVYASRALTLDPHDEVALSALRRIRRCLPNSPALRALSVDEGSPLPSASAQPAIRPPASPRLRRKSPPVPLRARLATALDAALYLGQRLGFALLILLVTCAFSGWTWRGALLLVPRWDGGQCAPLNTWANWLTAIWAKPFLSAGGCARKR